jgi:hypothetical protein
MNAGDAIRLVPSSWLSLHRSSRHT